MKTLIDFICEMQEELTTEPAIEIIYTRENIKIRLIWDKRYAQERLFDVSYIEQLVDDQDQFFFLIRSMEDAYLALELSRQNKGIKDLKDSAKALALMGKCGIDISSIKDVHVTTGSLVLCPSCSGKGCVACKGAGTLKDVRHTPSA